MSRRPHWDDDLIEAVACAIVPEEREREVLTNEMIYFAVAAVEDWQDANGFSRAGTLMRRLIDAEAAIQRVREVCEDAQERQLERASVLAMRVLDIVNGTDEYGAWCRALGIDGGAE